MAINSSTEKGDGAQILFFVFVVVFAIGINGGATITASALDSFVTADRRRVLCVFALPYVSKARNILKYEM